MLRTLYQVLIVQKRANQIGQLLSPPKGVYLMAKYKIFRVIEIIDERHILINCGLEDGIKEGDLLRIFEEGESVIDPKTGQTLGTFDYIKTELEVVTPYEKFSLCEKINRSQTNFLSTLDSFVTTSKTVAKLDVNGEEMTHRKLNGNPTISVGDLARLL